MPKEITNNQSNTDHSGRVKLILIEMIFKSAIPLWRGEIFLQILNMSDCR